MSTTTDTTTTTLTGAYDIDPAHSRIGFAAKHAMVVNVRGDFKVIDTKVAGIKVTVLVAFNGRAVAREIKVVSQRSNGYLVDRLTGGEDIIVNAPADLKEGDRIRIKQ